MHTHQSQQRSHACSACTALCGSPASRMEGYNQHVGGHLVHSHFTLLLVCASCRAMAHSVSTACRALWAPSLDSFLLPSSMFLAWSAAALQACLLSSNYRVDGNPDQAAHTTGLYWLFPFSMPPAQPQATHLFMMQLLCPRSHPWASHV